MSTSHLTEDQMLALLHGALPEASRAEAAGHLRGCAACAERLASEAQLDELLYESRKSAPPLPARMPRRRRRPAGWLVGGIGAVIGVGAAVAIGYAGAPGTAGLSAGGENMGDPLAWQNLIFYIPLAAGLLLILGSAFTGHGGHDGDHEHDGDHDHHGFGRILSVLGVGKVPLTVALMTALVLFGGLGIIMNVLLGALGLAPGLIGPISLVAASIYAVILSGQTAKLVARFMPTVETYQITKQDFAGCTGTLLLPADESSGYAQVKDREGNVHNVKCRTVRGASLAKGASVLIIEYDEATRTFVVDANPTA